MNFLLGEFTKYELADSVTGEILAEGEVLTSQIEYPEIQNLKIRNISLNLDYEKTVELKGIIYYK